MGMFVLVVSKALKTYHEKTELLLGKLDNVVQGCIASSLSDPIASTSTSTSTRSSGRKRTSSVGCGRKQKGRLSQHSSRPSVLEEHHDAPHHTSSHSPEVTVSQYSHVKMHLTDILNLTRVSNYRCSLNILQARGLVCIS